MGRIGKTIKFLTLEEVVEINRQLVLTYGGLYTEGDKNLANSGSLEYNLMMIQSSFCYTLYPTLIEKAAVLAWRIISGHIFHDGNKRTGMEVCRLMLDINGYTMKIDREIINIAVQICTHEITFEEFVEWLKNRVSERNSVMYVN